MNRIYRFIKLFSLFLAVVVITAHAIIPHDHHMSLSFVGDKEPCSDNKSNSSHHPGFPVHCHAFNLLASERIVINFVPDTIHHKDFSISRLFISFFDQLQLTYIKVNESRESFTDPGIIGFSQMRAPPAIC